MTAVFLNVEEFMNSSNPQDILLDKEGKVWKKQETFFGEGLLPMENVPEGCANIANAPAFLSKINKKIPYIFLQQIVRFFVDVSDKKYQSEAMIQIFYHIEKEEYVLYCPEQSISKTRVSYQQNSDYTSSKDYIYVMDIHSHNTMSAFFSSTDDANEQETRLYGVVGRVDKKTPDILLRSSMEGNFTLLPLSTAFEMPEGYQLENLPFPKVSYPKEWMDAIDFTRQSSFTAPWMNNSKYGGNKFAKPKSFKPNVGKIETGNEWDYYDSWSDPFALDKSDDELNNRLVDSLANRKSASDSFNQLELFSNSTYERIGTQTKTEVKKDAPDWLAGSLAAKKQVKKTITTTFKESYSSQSYYGLSDDERELIDYNSSFGIEPYFLNDDVSNADSVKFVRKAYMEFLKSEESHLHVVFQRVNRVIREMKEPSYRYYLVDFEQGEPLLYDSGPFSEIQIVDIVVERFFDNLMDFIYKNYPNSVYYIDEFSNLLDYAGGDYGEFFDLTLLMKNIFFSQSDFVLNYAISKISKKPSNPLSARKIQHTNSAEALKERPFRIQAISLLSGEGLVARSGYRIYRQDKEKDASLCKTIAYSESFKEISDIFLNLVHDFLTFLSPLDAYFNKNLTTLERAKGYIVNELGNHFEGNSMEIDVLMDYNRLSKPIKFTKNIPFYRMVSRDAINLDYSNHTFL